MADPQIVSVENARKEPSKVLVISRNGSAGLPRTDGVTPHFCGVTFTNYCGQVSTNCLDSCDR